MKRKVFKKKRICKGYLTVEAALIFPVIFWVFSLFLCLISSYQIFCRNQHELYEQLQKTVLEKVEVQTEEEESSQETGHKEEVRASRKAVINLPMSLPGFTRLAWKQYAVLYGMEGRSILYHETCQQIVYITPNGEVYHLDAHCSYLNPSVHSATYEELKNKRNKSGAVYYACSSCDSPENPLHHEILYYTSFGNRYHKDRNCPGLKRSIEAVSLEDVGERRPCSKCGSENSH